MTESTSVHFRSPADLTGQAMGILFMVASAAVVLGSVLAGLVAHHFGIAWSLATWAPP